MHALQWGNYEAWSAYGAEVPLAVPAEEAEQVSRPLLVPLNAFHCLCTILVECLCMEMTVN